MPRGGARAGAGRPRKLLVKHLRDGTYKPSRHGPLPSDLLHRGTVLTMPMRPATWEPTESDLAALEAPGRAFVAAMVASYSVLPAEGVLVLEGGHIVDRLAALRDGRVKPAVRDEVLLSKQLAALIGQLRVDA